MKKLFFVLVGLALVGTGVLAWLILASPKGKEVADAGHAVHGKEAHGAEAHGKAESPKSKKQEHADHKSEGHESEGQDHEAPASGLRIVEDDSHAAESESKGTHQAHKAEPPLHEKALPHAVANHEEARVPAQTTLGEHQSDKSPEEPEEPEEPKNVEKPQLVVTSPEKKPSPPVKKAPEAPVAVSVSKPAVKVPAVVKAPHKEAVPHKAPAPGPWHVQLKSIERVESWETVLKAEKARLEQDLKASLGSASITPCSVDLGLKGLWVRLLVGPFASPQAAQVVLNKIQTQAKGAFVIRGQKCLP